MCVEWIRNCSIHVHGINLMTKVVISPTESIITATEPSRLAISVLQTRTFQLSKIPLALFSLLLEIFICAQRFVTKAHTLLQFNIYRRGRWDCSKAPFRARWIDKSRVLTSRCVTDRNLFPAQENITAKNKRMGISAWNRPPPPARCSCRPDVELTTRWFVHTHIGSLCSCTHCSSSLCLTPYLTPSFFIVFKAAADKKYCVFITRALLSARSTFCTAADFIVGTRKIGSGAKNLLPSSSFSHLCFHDWWLMTKFPFSRMNFLLNFLSYVKTSYFLKTAMICDLLEKRK